MSNDARIPSITELHNRAHERLRNAWREGAAPPVREADADRASGGAGDAGVRLDAIPKASDLYEKHRREAVNRWRNGGDDVRAPVSR